MDTEGIPSNNQSSPINQQTVVPGVAQPVPTYTNSQVLNADPATTNITPPTTPETVTTPTQEIPVVQSPQVSNETQAKIQNMQKKPDPKERLVGGGRKRRKKLRLGSILLWIFGIIVLAALGILIGLELYKIVKSSEDSIVEEESIEDEESEESEAETEVETMSLSEIRELAGLESMGDSLKEIEDAAVDIDATITIIDENIEESDDPPEL